MREDSQTLTSGLHPSKHTAEEVNALGELVEAFENSSLPLALRLRNFPRHVRRQEIARFLARYEIFKSSLYVHGSVIECGVFAGGGLMSWMHFSSILEPYNHTRRIIGFDTFAGFPSIHDKDKVGLSEHLHTGALSTSINIKEEIEHLVRISDRNRPLGHIPKVELVAGDACHTIPEYLEKHPYLLVSILYLDFDLYEPTRIALQYLYPRVVKGGIVAFDELNAAEFPGETMALLEVIGIERARLQRYTFDPYISYFVKE
jgi:hypothetical protein